MAEPGFFLYRKPARSLLILCSTKRLAVSLHKQRWAEQANAAQLWQAPAALRLSVFLPCKLAAPRLRPAKARYKPL